MKKLMLTIVLAGMVLCQGCGKKELELFPASDDLAEISTYASTEDQQEQSDIELDEFMETVEEAGKRIDDGSAKALIESNYDEEYEVWRKQRDDEANRLEWAAVARHNNREYYASSRFNGFSLSLGLTTQQVLDGIGRPASINRSTGRWGVHEQWVYGPGRRYFYFDNGILTCWQD